MVTGAINIANKFNEYFTNIGPQLARSIDGSNRIPFHSYLTKPCSSSFGFQYTNPTDVSKIINKMKPKSSAGYDNISSKLLIQIGDIIACPLSIIINQSLCTGIFPKKLKRAKVIPLYKKDDEKSFGNYRPISLLSSFSKIFEKLYLTNFMTTSLSMIYCIKANTGSVDSTQLNWLHWNLQTVLDNKSIRKSTFLSILRSIKGNWYIKSWHPLDKVALLWYKRHVAQLVHQLPRKSISVCWV